MQVISLRKIKCFIAVDTNIDLHRINENASKLFYNTVISAAFKLLITLPTRLPIRNTLLFDTFLNIHVHKFVRKPVSIDICLNRFFVAVENKLSDVIYSHYNKFSLDENYDKVFLYSNKNTFMTKTVYIRALQR